MKINKIIAGISAISMLAVNASTFVSAAETEEAAAEAPVIVAPEAPEAPEAPKPPVVDEEEEAARKAEREAKKAEDDAKREAEKAEREANKPVPPVPPVLEDGEKPEPPKPEDLPKPDKLAHCHKIDDLVNLAVDTVLPATENLSDEELVDITTIAIPLIRNLEKPQIKALVKEVLADGVIDANDLVSLKGLLADAAAEEVAEVVITED